MINKIFVAFDADNAGRTIGTAVLMDDADALHENSSKIVAGSQSILDWATSNGGQIISSGGDEGVVIIPAEKKEELEQVRQKYEQLSGFTATMGVGFSLSQAGKSLIAGKLTGKNKLVTYDETTEDILKEAHEATLEGDATEEQVKMDEHYLSTMMDQESMEHDDQQMDDMSQEMPNPDQEQAYEEDFSQEQEMPEENEMYQESEEEPSDFKLHGEDYEESYDGESEEHCDDVIPEEGEDSDYIIHDYDHQGEEDEEDPELEKDYENPQKEFIDPEIMEELNLEKENEEEEPMHEELELPEEIDQMDLPTPDQVSPQGEPMAEMPQGIGDQDDLSALESELADSSSNEEVLQRIAQNLAMFKENKELLEKIKESNPQLYSSILELLHNMIELASTVQPDIRPEENSGDDQEEQIPDKVQNIDNWQDDQEEPAVEKSLFPKKRD